MHPSSLSLSENVADLASCSGAGMTQGDSPTGAPRERRRCGVARHPKVGVSQVNTP